MALMVCLVMGHTSHAAQLDLSAKSAGTSSHAVGHQGGDATGSGHDGGKGWVAADSTFPQWITVDLGSMYDLSEIRQRFASQDLWHYKIEASNDDLTNDSWWTTLADHSAGVLGAGQADTVSGRFRYVRVYVLGSGSGAHQASSLQLSIAGKLTAQSSSSVATPVPAATPGILVGAQACNLWTNKMDWESLVNYPDRQSVMGYYDEAFDVSTDWQIKTAVEHGIGFMQSCWYRQSGNEGSAPVMASFDQFINSIANTAKYRSMMKWDINWINSQAEIGGVKNVADFTDNLVPFWINTYFAKPNYLTVDGKPVIAIQDFEAFIGQMGGLQQARSAIASFRNQVASAGFPGLILLTQQVLSTTPADHWVSGDDPRGVNKEFGNYYTHDYAHINADAAAVGFDAAFSYHIPTFSDLMVSKTPTDAQAIGEQVQAWKNWSSYSALPTVVSASVGWDSGPWGSNGASWRLTAADWGVLLSDARTAAAQRSGPVAGGIVLLDNWNEYGEGHYIAPTKKDGFSYIDSVAKTFVPNWGTEKTRAADAAPDTSQIPQVLTPNGQPEPGE